MINILIVEDEYMARMFLTNLIDWEKHGMKLIGSAKDGEEALLIHEAEQADIIISDLRMPKLTGIELLRELNARGFEGKFIVMSNYNEFEEVKEAMKQGAYDYILKVTTNEKEVLTVLEKAIKELKVKQHDFTEDEVDKYADTSLRVHEYLSEVLHANEEWSFDEEFERQHISSFTMVYLRLASLNVDSLEKEYKIHQYISNILHSFKNLLQANSMLLVDLSRTEFAVVIMNHHEKVGSVELLVSKITKNIQNYLGIKVESHQIKVFQSAKEARNYVKELQIEQSDSLQKTFSTCKQEVQTILQYIDEHLKDKITLTELANVINMNKTYISRMFKEETGKTLSEYITYCRMERAIQLMKNPNRRMKEIAIEVGIPDPLYFSRIFTKVNGKTPTEYREYYLNRQNQ